MAGEDSSTQVLTISHASKPLAMSRLYARAEHLIAMQKTPGSQTLKHAICTQLFIAFLDHAVIGPNSAFE